MATSDKKREQIIEDLRPVLLENEDLLEVATGLAVVRRMGSDAARRGTLFVTDRRVGVFTKKLGGHDLLDFSYGLLTSIEYKKGMMFGEVTLLASGDRTRFHQVDKDLVVRLVQIIRERMALSSSGNAIVQPVSPISLADELTKLATLKEVGVLSEEEFATQKAKLLS